MGVCTDEFTNLKRDLTIYTKDILQLENGVIKTCSGKIVDIAIGSQIGGLEIEAITADNIIDIPGADLDTTSNFVIQQEAAENSWANFTVYAYLKPSQTIRSISISVKLLDDNGILIYDSIILPTEYDATENALVYTKVAVAYPGFRTIMLAFNEPNSATEILTVEDIYIEMYSFDRPRTIDNLVFKSYAIDPIVSVPGQAWYNTTENVWKVSMIDGNGNLIVKTYASKDSVSVDEFIWMSVM